MKDFVDIYLRRTWIIEPTNWFLIYIALVHHIDMGFVATLGVARVIHPCSDTNISMYT